MNEVEDRMFKAPPKTKKERVNSLTTTLNERPEERERVLHSLFGEIQGTATEEEVKELDGWNQDLKEKRTRISKIQSRMTENENVSGAYNILNQRRIKLINEYNEILDKIELSMRKISDRVEDTHTQMIG